MTLPTSFEGYDDFLREVKLRIQQARQQAIWAVNHELVLLYWHIGHDISTRMRERGWGAKVIDRLSADVHAAFPDIKGFSVRNLKYMHGFASAYPNIQIVQEVLAQLSWYHHITLLDKVKDPTERE